MTMLGTPVSSFHEGELAGGHAQSTPGPSRPRHSLDYRPDETRRPMKSTYQILRDAGVDLELLPLVFLEVRLTHYLIRRDRTLTAVYSLIRIPRSY